MHVKRVSAHRLIAYALSLAFSAALILPTQGEPLNGWVTATGTPTLTEGGSGQLRLSWGGAGIAVYAPLGTNGYALAAGDRLTFSGFVTNTSFNWGNQQLRFGLFSGNAETTEVYTNWLGYWIPNTIGGSHSDGPHKRISGQTNGFWQTGGSAPLGPAVAATGSSTSGALPFGVYAFSIMLARLDATNLNISWELQNVADRSRNPVSGIYTFTGTATDANPNSWTFNRAMLFTGHPSGTVSCGELEVTFGHGSPVLANLEGRPAPAQAGSTPSLDGAGTKASQKSAAALSKTDQTEPGGALWLIFTGLIGIIGLLIWGIVIVKRLSRNAVLAHETRELSTRMIGNDSESSPDAWRQRALAAEALAAKQTQILDEKVGPELREFAKEALVQGLYHQRNALMETQKRAQEALMELENRLSDLHLPAHERIRAYERRIAELERELETRGEEMRELTKATLLLVRQKLEQERESEFRVKWE